MDTATSDSGEPNVEVTPEADTSDSPEHIISQQTSLPVESVLYSSLKYGQFLLSTYGWYILLIVILLIIVWSNVKPYFLKWKKKMEERAEEANYDPAKAENLQDSMMRSREKMQRELDRKAVERQEVVEKRKEEERDDRIKHWEEFKVVTKTQKPKPKADTHLRDRRDFFPLDGAGGGRGYRAARRTFGGGG